MFAGMAICIEDYGSLFSMKNYLIADEIAHVMKSLMVTPSSLLMRLISWNPSSLVTLQLIAL